ncbi:MAG: ABC transporter permease, partial [Cryobacterium sp.]|nr:ABC transporter permease [Oligoflexia bacterium]
MKNLIRYVALRHLQLRPARTILTTLGVAFGIALYLAISIINRSTQESFRENVESVSGKSQITISAGPTGFDESKLETIQKVEGVGHAVPMVEARAFFHGATEKDESLYIIGVDLLQESAVRTYKTTDDKIIDDPLIFLNQPDSLVVTKKFAAERGLTIDSKMDLATTNGSKVFTVRGLLEPEGAARAYGGSLAIMDIDGARAIFGKVGKIDRIDIVPSEGVDLTRLEEKLREKLGGGFTVERPEEQSAATEKMVASYQMMIAFFGSLALLVGLFLVFNSVSISVAERKREIGILRALGASRNGILGVFVLESAMMGLLGAFIGSGLGRILADFMVKQVTYSLSAQFHTNVQANHLELTLSQFLTTLALGAVTSAIAAFLPALRASRITPLEAMKSSGLESNRQERGGQRGVIFGATLLVFVYFSMRFQWNRIFAPIEQITQGASVLGAAFFGPALVFLMIRGLRKVTRLGKIPIFRLAQENLIRSRRRTATNVMA